MANEKKLSTELEEKIQNLAGDIYVQIEDKIVELIVNSELAAENKPENIAENPEYIAITKKNDELKEQLLSAKKAAEDLTKTNEETLATLTSELKTTKLSLQNAEALAQAQSQDTEVVLKEKIAEVTSLQSRIKEVNHKNEDLLTQITDANKVNQQNQEKVKSLTSVEQNLVKKNQANSASIEIQNQQISELTNKLNTANAELEHLKSSQNDQIEANSKSLTQIQQQSETLNKDNAQLTSERDKLKAELESVKANESALTESNGDLTKELNVIKEQLQVIEKNGVDNKQSFDKQSAKKQDLIKSLELQNKNYEETISGLNRSIEDLRADQERLNDEKVTLNKSLDEAERTVDEKKAAIAKLQKEHGEDINKLSELSLKQQEAEQSNSQITVEFDAMKEQYDNVLKKLNIAKEQNHQQKTKLEKTEIRLSELTESHSEKEKDNAVLQQEKASHQKAITNQQDALEKAAENARQLTADAQKAATIAKEDITKLTAQVKVEQEKDIANQQALTKLQSELEQQKAKIEQASQDIKQYQKQADVYKEQSVQEKEQTEQRQMRFEASREKQEIEYNKARETIKFLRDENHDLNSKLEQQVTELQDKLTEYRLRFEYAQKQLAKQ